MMMKTRLQKMESLFSKETTNHQKQKFLKITSLNSLIIATRCLLQESLIVQEKKPGNIECAATKHANL